MEKNITATDAMGRLSGKMKGGKRGGGRKGEEQQMRMMIDV